MPVALKPFEASRHTIAFEARDVIVVDAFGDLPPEVPEQMKAAAQELYRLSCEHRVSLIQIGPESNVWPDRVKPRTRRLGS